ncbi:hypothetical protein BpHYR1_026481 [Brachionus plicatilis]|uniref:Uncharacterized protein n=1 Tax=Brachionus plicatilis TaxID=10195 RepID=A0A3M7QHZ0_BRAPC|nr:hypothetical protein BpHYR1_026481 [Brachionus plicatilis]
MDKIFSSLNILHLIIIWSNEWDVIQTRIISISFKIIIQNIDRSTSLLKSETNRIHISKLAVNFQSKNAQNLTKTECEKIFEIIRLHEDTNSAALLCILHE